MYVNNIWYSSEGQPRRLWNPLPGLPRAAAQTAVSSKGAGQSRGPHAFLLLQRQEWSGHIPGQSVLSPVLRKQTSLLQHKQTKCAHSVSCFLFLPLHVPCMTSSSSFHRHSDPQHYHSLIKFHLLCSHLGTYPWSCSWGCQRNRI